MTAVTDRDEVRHIHLMSDRNDPNADVRVICDDPACWMCQTPDAYDDVPHATPTVTPRSVGPAPADGAARCVFIYAWKSYTDREEYAQRCILPDGHPGRHRLA